MAADDAKELLGADTAPAVQVELVEEILDNQAGVANISPHLLHHVGLFARSGKSIALRQFHSPIFRNVTRDVETLSLTSMMHMISV